ncbi:uncharacterized protein RMCC_5767 [Mycolicibacterium canariasense]|uniref:Head-to-tail adaptor n=1 Tax=Mycolicibacterium canariasense TaxID=228230 RepID=A0A100WIA3_MYCCR|nr:hypothetical protein [Mycolicibacterium canariasense]MCV7210155.1 hypothetical protein [Mycolicibacterium canariasense]ORU97861.1 hypothetical protein AWB94_29345 [Mycolicibacterium canariasense]GAS98802.1 uncharacterized protein RMCC_5767 [Mycolicibacterium canariasense]
MTSFSWPIDRTCLPKLPDLPDAPTEEQQATYDDALAARNAAEDLATQTLWALTGRQFGGEPIRLRPCPPRGWPWSWYLAAQWYGFEQFSGMLDCACAGACRMSSATTIHLPGPVYPPTVDDPIVVTVAGQPLDPTSYVLEGDVLYRRNGAVWPGQNLARPLGEPGTWSVDYQRGLPVPPGVDRLTGLLAKEFILACDGSKCRIPPTLVATTAKGVSHVFDPSKIIAAGFTGLPEIDRWIMSVNPHRLACASEVL